MSCLRDKYQHSVARRTIVAQTWAREKKGEKMKRGCGYFIPILTWFTKITFSFPIQVIWAAVLFKVHAFYCIKWYVNKVPRSPHPRICLIPVWFRASPGGQVQDPVTDLETPICLISFKTCSSFRTIFPKIHRCYLPKINIKSCYHLKWLWCLDFDDEQHECIHI